MKPLTYLVFITFFLLATSTSIGRIRIKNVYQPLVSTDNVCIFGTGPRTTTYYVRFNGYDQVPAVATTFIGIRSMDISTTTTVDYELKVTSVASVSQFNIMSIMVSAGPNSVITKVENFVLVTFDRKIKLLLRGLIVFSTGCFN